MKLAVCLAGLLTMALPAPALAQVQQQPNFPARAGPGVGNIAVLLADGYEIKAAFVNANTSYVFLQKATSAYMCSSQQGVACEKLN